MRMNVEAASVVVVFRWKSISSNRLVLCSFSVQDSDSSWKRSTYLRGSSAQHRSSALLAQTPQIDILQEPQRIQESNSQTLTRPSSPVVTIRSSCFGLLSPFWIGLGAQAIWLISKTP